VIDLEDVRLARIAQRRFGVAAAQVVKTLEVLEDSTREPNMIRALEERCLLSPEQTTELEKIRESGRPGGLKLISVLGKGASSTVYKARDFQGHVLAVKLMKDATARDFRRRECEVRALDRLSHPGIPRLLSVGTVEGRPYHSMELAEGETLAARAKREGPLSPAVVVAVGLAVARALAHVHESGFIHCDVKPSNVVLGETGARLIDFGLARPPGTHSRQAIGTPAYISPELARGEAASVATDVYSFGAMLYLALTGRFPHAAESPDAMIRLAADPTVQAKPLLAHREDLPARLIVLVESCLEKDPARRPASMALVVRALEKVRLMTTNSNRRGFRAATSPRALVRRRRRFLSRSAA
jgi:serine/threonine protein kinase